MSSLDYDSSIHAIQNQIEVQDSHSVSPFSDAEDDKLKFDLTLTKCPSSKQKDDVGVVGTTLKADPRIEQTPQTTSPLLQKRSGSIQARVEGLHQKAHFMMSPQQESKKATHQDSLKDQKPQSLASTKASSESSLSMNFLSVLAAENSSGLPFHELRDQRNRVGSMDGLLLNHAEAKDTTESLL